MGILTAIAVERTKPTYIQTSFSVIRPPAERRGLMLADSLDDAKAAFRRAWDPKG